MANIERKLSILIVALVTYCTFPVCTLSAEEGPEPIRVGAVLPFSGGVEAYGKQAKLGLDLAAKEINADGGILGHPLEVIYEDDKTFPDAAISATRKLIEKDKVLAVIGPITSRNLNAIKPVIEELKTPLLYATNYEGGACSRYIFSFSTVPNQELEPLLPYMNKTFGNTYFLLGADRVWPHEMFAVAESIIPKIGGHIVGTEYTLGQVKDFTPLIRKVANSKAKVLLFALKGDGLNFIAQADKQGLFKHTTVAFLGLSETDLPAFDGAGQNMFVIVPFVATSDMPKARAFVARAKEAAGADAIVSNYVMTHYNALMALKAALVQAGKVDKESLIDSLAGIKISSPTGDLSIGTNHHATMNLFLAETRGRELVTVESLGPKEPDSRCP